MARQPGEQSPPGSGASIALCHEWMAQWTGSEKTFAAMADEFPQADLYALTVNADLGFPSDGRRVTTTFIEGLRPLRRARALQLPLMPLAWRSVSHRAYDVVITSSHACVKGFRPGREALHLCYCYTPMRYAWLSEVDRRGHASRLQAAGKAYFRRWDRISAGWVDEFAAISTCVRDRVRRFYDRDATVIAPPVDTDYFVPAVESPRRDDFALAVSRLVGYKRIDLAIRACVRVGYPLIVAGTGPEERALRALAAGLRGDVTFVTGPDDAGLRDLYRRARVLVHAGEEDFGIVPVEAQACGTPVLAYGVGGVVDTVLPGLTGVLVADQDERSLAEGLEDLLGRSLDPLACRRNAERFGARRFRAQLREWVEDATGARGLDLSPD
jgi:glycosyltransferase involved in cell wall biosynthesis